MHPVLTYAIVFISSMIGLLFVFENYQLESFYLLLFITVAITIVIGNLLVRIFPSEDPMKDEIDREDRKQRASKYKREIQYLINIVQPDPKFQPKPKRLSDSLESCFSLDTEIMTSRLRQHFGEQFNIKTSLALPDMVEEIKKNYKDWPET